MKDTIPSFLWNLRMGNFIDYPGEYTILDLLIPKKSTRLISYKTIVINIKDEINKLKNDGELTHFDISPETTVIIEKLITINLFYTGGKYNFLSTFPEEYTRETKISLSEYIKFIKESDINVAEDILVNFFILEGTIEIEDTKDKNFKEYRIFLVNLVSLDSPYAECYIIINGEPIQIGEFVEYSQYICVEELKKFNLKIKKSDLYKLYILSRKIDSESEDNTDSEDESDSEG